MFGKEKTLEREKGNRLKVRHTAMVWISVPQVSMCQGLVHHLVALLESGKIFNIWSQVDKKLGQWEHLLEGEIGILAFLFLLCLLATVRSMPSCHVHPPWCTTLPQAQSNRPTSYRREDGGKSEETAILVHLCNILFKLICYNDIYSVIFYIKFYTNW